jgi:hypothetical protein
MTNVLLKGIEVAPILGLVVASFLDFINNSDHKTYFKKTRVFARNKIDSNFNLASNKNIKSWPFICFKQMLIRKSQSLFLTTLIVQLFFSCLASVTSILSSSNSNTLAYDYPITLFFTAVFLIIILVFGLRRDEPYSWYYPRYGMKCYKTDKWCFITSLVGRFSLIFFILILIIYEVKIIHYSLFIISLS